MSDSDEYIPKFDFLEQIAKEDTYTALFPTVRVGLAVIKLYSKIKAGYYPKGRFQEKDIYYALEDISKLKGAPYERIPQEYFNDLIIELQRYFLRYDEDEQEYSFKDYADVFCKHAEETLKASFNPTHIEIICNDLSDKLDKCRDETELENWLELNFETFKPKMKNQVDFLDRQIDNSVSEIRQSTQINNETILEVLKQIDSKLDNIRGQNAELRAAFRELNAINRQLEFHTLKIESNPLGNKINDARLFIAEIKYSLSVIDKRLDRIQPKLRQFFGMLNKPLFKVKIEKFFRFLLEYSEVTIDNSKKNVMLPKGIPLPQLYIQTPNFTIIERRNDLFPAVARRIVTPLETSNLVKQAYSAINTKIHQQDIVQEWLQRIELAVEEKGEIKFSDFFLQMMQNSNNNIEIPAKVAHSILKAHSQRSKIKVLTSQQKITFQQINTLSIWEMTLRKVD